MIIGDEVQRAKALALRQALWQTGIAYGQPPRLWRVSPNWYYLWGKQWQQIQDFGQLLPILRQVIGEDGPSTYLRADFTLDQRGNVLLLELNAMPVWDYGVQIVRGIYRELLGFGEGFPDFDPFPGAAQMIGDLLKRQFPGKQIAILLAPDRQNYMAEYRCMAKYLEGLGLTVFVTDDPDETQGAEVIYRTFTHRWLAGPDNTPVGFQRLKERLDGGEVEVWPPFSVLDGKLWMAALYNQGLARRLGWHFASIAEGLEKFVPWTWPVDPHETEIQFGAQRLGWHSEELTGSRRPPERQPKIEFLPGRPGWGTVKLADLKKPGVVHNWVLKEIWGAQARGTAFSSELSVAEWRQWLLEALVRANGSGPVYVIQPEVPTLRHRMTYLEAEGEKLITSGDFRVRICITYLVEGSQVKIIDGEATLRDHPLVHNSSDSVVLPVVVRTRR